MLGTLIETITDNGEYNRTPQPQDGVDGWNDIRLTVDVRILITSLRYSGTSFPLSSMLYADDSVLVTLPTYQSFLFYISPKGSLTFFDAFSLSPPYTTFVPPGYYYLAASYNTSGPNDFQFLTSSGSIVLTHRYTGSDHFTLTLSPSIFQFDFPVQSYSKDK